LRLSWWMARIMLPDHDPRQAKEIGDICRTRKCSIYLSTSTFLRFCLRKCGPEDFKTLRILICGAEKLPQAVAQDFEKKFGVLPLEGYGCTELSPVVSTNVPDWEQRGVRQVGNKPGTIGQPIPGVAARPLGREAPALQIAADGPLRQIEVEFLAGHVDELVIEAYFTGAEVDAQRPV